MSEAQRWPADGDNGAPGWAAELDCVFALQNERTVIDTYRHRGPLVIQRPFYPEGGVCHVYLLHPPGGVVAGDSLAVRLQATPETRALITNPGATKFYRSNGPLARLRQQMQVDKGACLEWLPQENIVFAGANVDIATELRLSTGASFLGWEIFCLGRPASGERFHAGDCDARLEIWRDGRPLLLERQRICGSAAVCDAAWGLMGYDVSASFVAIGATPADLAAARDLQPPGDASYGLTLVEDVLVARCLARYAEPVKTYFQALWRLLRTRLLQREACPPRVWLT